MKLLFSNSRGIERIIGEPNCLSEATKIIRDFLEEHNFKSYYTIMQFDGDRLEFDVGSHTEFFYLDEIDNKTLLVLKERGLSKHAE
jgi:hypothetical protein